MSQNRSRPIGVWVFLFLNILVVMPWAAMSIYSNIQDEGYVADNPPYMLALALASFISTVGAWMGNRYSRIAMLVLLTLVQLLLMFVATLLVAGQLSVPPANRPSPSSVQLYFSIIGLSIDPKRTLAANRKCGFDRPVKSIRNARSDTGPARSIAVSAP